MPTEVKLKVCGMRDAENITSVSELSPDYLGFIFYQKSPRYVSDMLDQQVLEKLPKSIKRIGVFVNESPEKVVEMVKAYGLNLVQLHGDESPDTCAALKEKGIAVIKAFSVGEKFDFDILLPYKPYVKFFLFDTKGKDYGGNGVTFDWTLLEKYDNEVPFFLSGGIGLEHVETIKKLDKLNIHALDVNSRFESSPGVKDYDLLKKFKSLLYQDTTVNS